MRVIYTTFLYLLLPVIVVRMLFRSLYNPAYRKRWHERFGFVQDYRHEFPLIWIHAVSVGEVRAAKPLVDALRTEYTGYEIMMTTMTPTGADTVMQLFGGSVMHHYVPYDLPGAVKRFITATRPDFLMVMETELWPNLFHYCRISNVPVMLINGRMSAQSAGRYKLAAALTRSALGDLSLISAQNHSDARRFVSLGASADKISVTGNLKFDFTLTDNPVNGDKLDKHGWPSARPVWIAASTHAGEESVVLQAHTRILNAFPDCLLILVPRHPERAREISGICTKSGFNFIQKTAQANPDASTQVMILDTLGELVNYYAMAHLAFVGGSLVRAGGQNMLEPAAAGIPVITGPYYFNFQEIGTLLQQAGAAYVIHNEHELADRVVKLLTDEKLRHDAGQCGRRMVLEGKGSTARVLKCLKPILGTHHYATKQNNIV